MAQRPDNRRRPAPRQNPRQGSRRPPQRRRQTSDRFFFRLEDLLRKEEFKEDNLGTSFFQKLFLTRQQRLSLLRWGSYILSCLVCLLLQDCILSRAPIFGANLDLPAMMILLITVIEGTETGSVFALIASLIYYFTGSAPGPYVVALMVILGMAATLFRQLFWHRSRIAMTLCACLALMVYEIAVFVISLLQGLTHWGRFPLFLITGAMSCLVLIVVFPLIHRFGKIGGHVWKE